MESGNLHIPAPMAEEVIAIMERIKRINARLDRCEKITQENGEANGRSTDGR